MKSFALDISKFIQKCDTNADVVVSETVTELGKELIDRTPVGDPSYWRSPPPKGYVGGHARANWNYFPDRPVRREYQDIDGSPAESNVSYSRILSRVKLKGAAQRTHYLQNSVPYIERLEDGWSDRQSPPNAMVGLTVLKFQTIVDNVARKLK